MLDVFGKVSFRKATDEVELAGAYDDVSIRFGTTGGELGDVYDEVSLRYIADENEFEGSDVFLSSFVLEVP